MQKRIVALCLSMFVLIAAAALAQEEKASRPSPAAQAQCQFADGKTIRVDYSSPRAKGRKIYGGLVPYGEVWRTGANDATTFVTDANLSVNGKDVHRKVGVRHEGRGVIGTGAPDFAVGYESTVNLAAFCAWAGVIDTNGLAICELALCLCRRAGPAGLLFLRKCSNCNQNEHRKT